MVNNMECEAIYRLARPEDIELAQKTGFFTGSPMDKNDGFIHASCTMKGVKKVAQEFFKEGGPLILVRFDPSKFFSDNENSDIIFEALNDDMSATMKKAEEYLEDKKLLIAYEKDITGFSCTHIYCLPQGLPYSSIVETINLEEVKIENQNSYVFPKSE